MSELQKICHPLILDLCRVWLSAQGKIVIHVQEQRRAFLDQLQNIREKVVGDPILERDFKRIEKPLVFFIDYTMRKILEGSSTQWPDIALEYNELAGDEKFFEMLTQALDDPDSAPQLTMYYLFMGLGFEGVQSREFVEKRMRVCAARLPQEAAPGELSLSSENILKNFQFRPARRKPQTVFWYTLLVLVVLLLGAFLFNYNHFHRATESYRKAISEVINEINSGVRFREKKTGKTSSAAGTAAEKEKKELQSVSSHPEEGKK